MAVTRGKNPNRRVPPKNLLQESTVSMYKHLTLAVALSATTSLLGACGPADLEPTAAKQSRLGPWIPVNAGQFRGGEIAGQTIDGLYYSTTPPTGTAPSPTGWWISVPSSSYFAPVTRMTYEGVNYSGLSTQQGWLVAEGDTEVVLGAEASKSELTIYIGAPLNAALRIHDADDYSSYGEYQAEWHLTDDDVWQPYCPHPVLNDDREIINQPERMIAVGGVRWALNGSRSTNPNAIQLSCTHDAVGACASWGYHPWNSTLAGAHQACTRMKRADYCGVGEAATTTWTNNLDTYATTQIEVWDSVGVHASSGQTTSTMEAYWNGNGATCFNQDGFRSNDATAITRMQTVISTYCPNIPSCSSKSSGLLGSARPCLSYDQTTGNCISN